MKTKKVFRRILSLVLCLVCAAAMMPVMPKMQVKAAGLVPQAGNIYYIKNKNSQKYLTVQNDSGSAGANVYQSNGTGSLGQRWILEKNSNGTYRLHPATDMTGGMSLDVAYGSANNGTNIQIWSNNGASAQNFSISACNDGYMITTACTSGASCLDVQNASTSHGANVVQNKKSYSASQTWYFEQAQWPSSNSGSSNSGSSNSGSTTTAPTTSGSSGGTKVAVDNGYAMQRIQFLCANNNQFVNASGSSVSLTGTSATSNQWVLENNGANQYLIINAATGQVLAPNGNKASSGAALVTTGKNGSSAQYWNISAANYDVTGAALTYKITNCANANLAIVVNSGKLALGSYSGSSTHRFAINSYGVEGFAGKCKSMDGREHASVTGGLFGKTVYVSDFNSLANYCSGSTPYTIVIKSDIYKSSLSKINVGSNKTIIGSFGANKLSNVHFRCINGSNNIIFKNLTLAHDSDKNANDDIQIYISTGNNYWIDHCTFPGHSSLRSNDVDKLLYVGLKADYVSVTGNVFMNHEYGLILGYPQEDGVGKYNGYPHMTICNNYFYNVLTRAPGLMRYGYFHCYNNFVYGFNLAYTPYTGCNIYSEYNYFEKGGKTGCVVDDKGVGGFTDNGSVLTWSVSNLKTGKTSFRPINNYSYKMRNAADAKAWAQKNAGVQKGSIAYAID